MLANPLVYFLGSTLVMSGLIVLSSFIGFSMRSQSLLKKVGSIIESMKGIRGNIVASLLGMTTFYRAWKHDYPRMPKATWLECFQAFRESVWGLLLIVIVLGGIYTGMFTPTEAAAVSAVYAFVIAVFVYRDMGLRDIPRVLLGSANMSAIEIGMPVSISASSSAKMISALMMLLPG